MRVVTRRAVRLPDRAMMVGVLLQQGRHVDHGSAVGKPHLLVVAAEARVEERTLQKRGQGGGMSGVAIPASLFLGHGPVNHRALFDQSPDVLVTGHAERAIVLTHLLGIIRTVRIVALLTLPGHRRVNVPRLLVPAHPVFMARGT